MLLPLAFPSCPLRARPPGSGQGSSMGSILSLLLLMVASVCRQLPRPVHQARPSSHCRHLRPQGCPTDTSDPAVQIHMQGFLAGHCVGPLLL